MFFAKIWNLSQKITHPPQYTKVIVLTFLCAIFGLTISKKLFFIDTNYWLSQRWIASSVIILYIATASYYVKISNWNRKHKIANLIKLLLVNLIIMLFWMMIDNRYLFTISGFGQNINIDTSWSIYLFLGVIWWKHWSIFIEPKAKQVLLSIEVLIINTFFLSLIRLFEVDHSASRNWTVNPLTSFLGEIISYNSILFLFLNLTMITALLLIEIHKYSVKKLWLWAILVFYLLIQSSLFIGIEPIAILQNTNYTYWHKAILLTVIWSLIYQNLRRTLKPDNNTTYLSKLSFSNFYHFVLLITIAIFS